MKNKILAVAGAAALVVSMSASISYAGNGYLLPGETMGASLDSPLPEGVFAFDNEYYSKADAAATRVGVNIPGLIWSTPWSAYNTRLEFLAVFPFAHLDGAANGVGAITQAYGPILAHDFGGGWTGGVSAFIRTADPSGTGPASAPGSNAFVNHNVPGGDFRESLQWSGAIGGITGITINENGYYNTDFKNAADPYINDLVGGDFSIKKTFDKLTIGFTGFGFTGLENRALSGGRGAAIELGGLVGYDFGKVSLTAIVTRSVLARTNGVNTPGAFETRGELSLVVPLYVAPAPAAVVARY
jgi:hypothetical protein